MSYPVGIDFGTTFSTVCQYINGNPVMKPIDQINSPYVPTKIGFEEGEWIFGKNMPDCIIDIKRMMGETYDSDSFKIARKSWDKYNIKFAKDENQKNNPKESDQIKIIINDQKYTPVDLAGKYINWLYTNCGGQFGDQVTVITIPAKFGQLRREAICLAYQKAGFSHDQLRIMSEPSAAALCVCLMQQKKYKNIMVFDFGGGTLDSSFVEITYNTEIPEFREIEKKGIQLLGGRDIDEILFNWTIERLKQLGYDDLDPDDDYEDIEKIMEACEKAKIDLAQNPNCKPKIIPKNSSIKCKRCQENIVMDIDTFERISAPVFDRLHEPLDELFSSTKIRKSDVDGIMIIGGSSQNRKVKQIVEEYFQRPVINFPHFRDAVAMGACLQAASLTPGINVVSNLKIPENQNQGQKGFVVKEVIPHSLGIEVVREDKSSGWFSAILVKGINFFGDEEKGIYSTIEDNQTGIIIDVYECDEERVEKGRLYKTYIKENLPPLPAGQAKIEITFNLDLNGMLQVSVREIGKDELIVYKPFKIFDELRKIENEDNINNQRKVENHKKILMSHLLQLDIFFDETLPEIISDYPDFDKIVNKEKLLKINAKVKHFLNSESVATEDAIETLIAEGRKTLEPFYLQRNMEFPEVFKLSIT